MEQPKGPERKLLGAESSLPQVWTQVTPGVILLAQIPAPGVPEGMEGHGCFF